MLVAYPQWRESFTASASRASSPPAHPMNESPTGQPASDPMGRVTWGSPPRPAMQVRRMTRTLAFEEVAHGVRVNAVCPGSTLTDFHISKAKAAGKSVETLKTERQTTSLLGRWATPQEIAWPILWLASEEASFITGATLAVDGGLSIM